MNPKFHCLVADTTAFINNISLQEYADNIVTVPDVVKEIKHKRQLKRLCVLPYDLSVDEPTPENIKYIIEFAKKIGDYRSLSSVDIKVIALTYQLEKQLIGEKHLRTEPITPVIIASNNKPEEFVDTKPLVGFYMPPTKDELKIKSLIADAVFVNKEDFDNTEKLTKEINDDIRKPDDSEKHNEIHDNNKDDAKNVYEQESKEYLDYNLDLNLAKIDLKSVDDVLMKVDAETTENIDYAEERNDSGNEEDDDNDDSWITPSNIAKVKSEFGKNIAEDVPVRVACITTDYAIQNILKQINLNIVALDGKIIKQMRTYILRCYGCFKTTSIMTKVFCPNCGHKTLKKVATSLDANGQQVIHINTRRPITAKGKNTSIPRPRGGKHSTNPILFEDQPIPKQMPSRVMRTKTNAMNEDYVTGYSPFVRRDVDSKAALIRAKHGENIKQWARNNAYRNLQQSQKKL